MCSSSLLNFLRQGDLILVNVLIIPGFADFAPVYVPDCFSLLASDTPAARKI